MKIAVSVFLLPALIVLPLTVSAAEMEKSQYRLHPADVLNITVHNQPDLTTRTRISSDGYISFPLIGKVLANGLTAQELELNIKESLEKDYLVKAEVLVFIEQYHARQVSVIGEVNKPGKFEMPVERDITVLEAIAMAGGFTKDAEVNKTRIMRIENGEKKAIIIRVKDITEKGEKDKDIVLQPDDVVFVPESFF